MALVIFVRYACKCQKRAALIMESFPCNDSINAVLTGFNSSRHRVQVKFKAKIIKLMIKSFLNAIKTRKRENRLFYKIILHLLFSNFVEYVMVL